MIVSTVRLPPDFASSSDPSAPWRCSHQPAIQTERPITYENVRATRNIRPNQAHGAPMTTVKNTAKGSDMSGARHRRRTNSAAGVGGAFGRATVGLLGQDDVGRREKERMA